MTVRQSFVSPTLIRWGPIIAGAVIGFALMILLSSFWAAIGGGTGVIADNIHWFSFASAVVALFVAGLFAGWLSGIKGMGHGLLHGLTVWALVLTASTLFPFPAAFGLFGAFSAPLPQIGTGTLWASFLALLIGLVAAAAGGVLGGGLTAPAVATEEHSTVADRQAGEQPTTREQPSREGPTESRA